MHIQMSCLIIMMLFINIKSSYSQTIISGGSNNDIIGRIVKLSDNYLYCIIERNPDWGSGDFYITYSIDNGYTWSVLIPVLVQSGNQSTFSLIQTPDDSLRLFYASDETGQYKIYSLSSFDGITWSNKHMVLLGWPVSIGVYDPQLIVEEDSSLTMIYVKMGGGCYVSHYSSLSGWDQNMTLVQSGAFRAGICKKEGLYLAAYHRSIGGNYDIHVKTSSDLINWSSETNLTSNGNSHDAYCNTTVDGNFIVYYAKVVGGNYNIHRRISSDGINWQVEEQFTNDNVYNTQPAFISDSNYIYLCYTHAVDYNTNNDIYLQRTSLTLNIENTKVCELNAFYSNGWIFIKSYGSYHGIQNYELYDMYGKKVLSGEYKNKIQVDQLLTGVYFLRTQTSKGLFLMKKMMIIR